MKKAIGLEYKGNGGVGTARVAGGKWKEILIWQRLEEQMAQHPNTPTHVGEKTDSYKIPQPVQP